MAEVAENLVTVFQFTHPCGCDHYAKIQIYWRNVSIHAPVWVRLLVQDMGGTVKEFQFTHPCGCDVMVM